MGTKIVELWVEIHFPEADGTPGELQADVLVRLPVLTAGREDGRVILIRSNAFEAPDPEPAGQDPEDNPIPDDGSTGGDG